MITPLMQLAPKTSATDPDPPVHPYTTFVLYTLLFVLCFVTYHGIYDNYLFNDDFSWMREARHGMEPGNLLTYQVVNFFRPLINLSFYLLERISPGNIPLHYAFNLVLHFMNTILVYHLAKLLVRSWRIAAGAAVLFAVTSVHAGAVLWISARTTLLSTFLLLASLLVLLSDAHARRRASVAATALFILALAAKETAVAGLPLLLLVFLPTDGPARRKRIGRTALVSFAIVTTVYLVIRTAIMGGFLQEAWGPGMHMLRNIAGGFLYQFYPFPLFSLFWPTGTYIPEPAHPFVPEILVVPIIAFLLWIGAETGRRREMLTAAGWMLIALIPVSAFRYRFFSTESITQSRYYYLSSVGSVLAIVILLSMLWKTGSRLRRIASASIFVLLLAGYLLRVHRLERKWDHFTGMYRETVRMVTAEMERHPEATTIVIQDPPLAFPYIDDALVLSNRSWKVHEAQRREDAVRRRPCLYIYFSGEYPKVMKLEQLR